MEKQEEGKNIQFEKSSQFCALFNSYLISIDRNSDFEKIKTQSVDKNRKRNLQIGSEMVSNMVETAFLLEFRLSASKSSLPVTQGDINGKYISATFFSLLVPIRVFSTEIDS